MFFPRARWNHVTSEEARDVLREAFARWGMPTKIRVDNGFPWGSTGDFPTDFSLWIIGLGIDMIWNPPRQPQKNGVVERSQGTGKRWAEPGQCDSAATLQQRIDEMDQLQREDYPQANKMSRMELFPQLRHSHREYVPSEEATCWQWQRAADHLCQYTACRRVDKSGVVWVYNRRHYIGSKYCGTNVYATFDPIDCDWIFRDERGNQLRTRPATELTRDSILALQVTGPHGKTQVTESPAKLNDS